ncbi:hypothetical protein [Spirosoma gilvum]
MGSKKKQLFRIVFDVLDGTNQQICQNGDVSIAATDPDEAIDWVFAEMQRQFKRPDIRLSRVRVGI